MQEFSPEEQAEFLRGLGLAEPGIYRLVRESQRLLGLVTFYTSISRKCGPGGCRRAPPAPQAAGRVHSDMEKGFIRVEVMSLDDLSRLGSPARVREGGRVQVEGRDYLVRDGDIRAVPVPTLKGGRTGRLLFLGNIIKRI